MKYPGAKSNSGLPQFLINNIPAHSRYFELYAGSAKLYYAKQRARENIITEVDDDLIRYHLERNTGNNTLILHFEALLFLLSTEFTADDFIYLDPPYPFLSRRRGKKYYKNEMTDDDHVQLLLAIRSCKANVMISTRQNELYSRLLHDWRMMGFATVDRGGATVEIIYMNYDPPVLLHQYDYVGQGFSDRQRIKRKVIRFHDKINALPAYEKHMLIQEMVRNDSTAVQHFLTMEAALKK